jgi:DNA-binding response OmpR family regulator
MGKHIVVIDDCRVTLAMVSDFLGGAGYRVSTSDCCVYSNHLIYGSRPPDLILLDVMMPLMPGDKKVRLLKGREKSRQIPVLLMSSKEEGELRSLAAGAGADGYLPKPFSADQLLHTVRRHLPSRRYPAGAG